MLTLVSDTETHRHTDLGDTVSSTKRKRKEGAANLALALAMVGKRTSSAAGTHGDKRAKRARTRAAQRARILREW